MLSLFLSVIEDKAYVPVFEKIYEKYELDVFNAAFNIIQDHYKAEEASQNAWVSIARNIHRIDTSNESMLRSYIIKVAKNAAINLSGKRAEDIRHIDTYDPFPCITDIQEDLENDEAYAKIVGFIKSLPEIYFDVLSMHLLFGFSTSEIALSLGLKHSTVKQRLTRGKKLLRKVLEEAGIQ